MDRHFKAYNNLLYKIKIKNMELVQLKANWYNISGLRYDDLKTKGGKPVDIADQLHKIVEKEKELKAIIDYKDELRKVHEDEINKVEEEAKRSILTLFYLDKCTNKQIAYCLSYTVGHVKKLKRAANKEFLEKNKTPFDTL